MQITMSDVYSSVHEVSSDSIEELMSDIDASYMYYFHYVQLPMMVDEYLEFDPDSIDYQFQFD